MAQWNKEIKSRALRKKLYQMKEWWTVRSLLGNTWAYFYILLGARERGKSYSVMCYCLIQWVLYKKTFTWMKLNEASQSKMLKNNASKFIDADLVRSFGLHLKTRGTEVYNIDKNGKEEKLADVLCLSTAYNDKGVAMFDNMNQLGFNIVLDEFQLERGQRRTFDVSYNLVLQLENLVRSSKEKIRIFFIGNTTEEASDILSMFNFIPQEFGVYKLKSKKCVIDYMPNSEAYIQRRKGTVGDILAGSTSNFTNKIETDTSDIYKGRLNKPLYIIKFSKDQSDWFCVWDNNCIAKYNKENKQGIAMRRYIEEIFDPQVVMNVFEQYDSRAFMYKNLITKKQFSYQLSMIKRQ